MVLDFDTSFITGLAVALGAGLLIGVERERRKGSGPTRAFAGVRTFTLAALGGALAGALGTGVTLIGAILVAALAAVSHRRDRDADDPGATTEVALFVTYLIGASAIERPTIAAAAGAVVLVVLHARALLHRFARDVLSADEVRDAVVLAGLAFVVLPVLPAGPQSLLGGLDPSVIGRLAVALMALQSAGYVATRALGAKHGPLIAGLAAGFVSSTATIAGYGNTVRRAPAQQAAYVAGALASNVATLLQLALVAALVAPEALRVLASPLLAGAIPLVLVVIWQWHAVPSAREAVAPGRAFDLRRALALAFFLSVVGLMARLAAAALGPGAVVGVAGLAGFADAHAAAASALALSARDALSLPTTLVAVLVGLTTNTVSKIVAAFASGGRDYGMRIALGVGSMQATIWAVAMLEVGRGA